MTDFGISFRSSDDSPQPREKVAVARAQARLAAEQYVQLRRSAAATRNEAREVREETARLRASLRASVAAYAAALRGINVPPERAIVLVKTTVAESDSHRDNHHRHVVEEVVTWAVDAYYAA